MQPDRALRRLIADLADLPAKDQASILDMLEPAQRGRITVLMREYSGTSADAASSVLMRPDTSALSPWLAHRVQAGEDMTDEAAALLRECAEALFPRQPASGSPRGVGLGRLIRRGGAA